MYQILTFSLRLPYCLLRSCLKSKPSWSMRVSFGCTRGSPVITTLLQMSVLYRPISIAISPACIVIQHILASLLASCKDDQTRRKVCRLQARRSDWSKFFSSCLFRPRLTALTICIRLKLRRYTLILNHAAATPVISRDDSNNNEDIKESC